MKHRRDLMLGETRHRQARPSRRLHYGLVDAVMLALTSTSLIFAALFSASLLLAAPAMAERGPVTNLPMPRYVSLKGSEGNARRGPSTSHRIDWVFVRRDMPLQVIGEYDNWRQVRDREGASGWVHYTLLSGVRTVIVDYDMVPLRSSPQDGAAVVAHLEAGVIARLGECKIDWCRVSIDGYRGWLRKTAIWGVDPEEIRD